MGKLISLYCLSTFLLASAIFPQSTQAQQSKNPFILSIKPYPSNNFGKRTNNIDMIVIHSTEGSLKSALNTLTAPHGNSSHYLVSDNAVFQLVNDTNKAWHVGPTANARSIGVEVVGFGYKPGFKFSDSQYTNAAALALVKSTQYGIPYSNIVSHKWVSENLKGTDHIDPGPNFDWNHFKNAYETLRKKGVKLEYK